MPSAALVAMTVQVVGSVVLRTIPVTLQPIPVTAIDTAPLPEPPATVTVRGVPAVPFLDGLVISSTACVTPEKVKSTGALVAAAKMPHAALVAVTRHVVISVALRADPVIEQPVPVTAKETAPDPDPPETVTGIGVPARPVVVVFEIANAAWGAAVKVNMTGALAVEA